MYIGKVCLREGNTGYTVIVRRQAWPEAALEGNGRMGHLAFADGHPVHGHFTDAVIVDKGSRDDKHVEYLM